jgi:tetratricopeptide (TPR) repeat protein
MRAYTRSLAVLGSCAAVLLGFGLPVSGQLSTRAIYVDQGSFQLPPPGTTSPREPIALAVGAEGSIHVVDEDGGIFAFDASGEPAGSYGSGFLGRPTGIAFDDRGTAYVIDRDPNRIQVFRSDREWWYTIGAARRGPGRLRNPVDLAVGPDGYVYVLDESGPSVRVFGRDGVFVRSIDLPPQIDDPVGVAVDGDGAILITSKRVPGSVFQLAPFAESPWRRLPAPQAVPIGATGEPVGIVADGRGTMVVLDSKDRRLFGGQRVEQDPAVLSRPIYGGQGTGRGSFREPVDVAFAADREVVILDRELRKVERIRLSDDEAVVELASEYPIRVSLLPPDLQGTVFAVEGPRGGSTRVAVVSERSRSVSVRERVEAGYTDFFGHQFRAMSIAEGSEAEAFGSSLQDPPSDVAFNDTLLVIAEPKADRFAVFDIRDGSSLGAYGNGYEDDRRLDEPLGVALFPDASIAVADHRNDRVAVFSPDLASLLGSFRFPKVQGVVVSRSGELYAWDESGLMIAQVPSDGPPVQLASEFVPGPVADIAFDAAGNMFLLEAETSRVTVVNRSKDRILLRFGGRDPGFEATRISVDDVGNVYLASAERDSTHTYRWDVDLPELTGLQVMLTEEGATLDWSPIESQFLDGYSVLGSGAPDAPFETLELTSEVSMDVVAGPTDPVRWLRVAPVTIAGSLASGPEAVPLYHLEIFSASEAGDYDRVVRSIDRLEELRSEGTVGVVPRLWQELQWQAIEAEAALGRFEEAAEREPELDGWIGPDGGFTVHRRLAEIHHQIGNSASVLDHATAALDLMPEEDRNSEVAADLLRLAVPAAFATNAHERVLGMGEELRPQAAAEEEYQLIMWLATSRLELDQPAMALRMAEEVAEREGLGDIISYGTDRDDLGWAAFRSAVRLDDVEAVGRWRAQVEPTVTGDRRREFQILMGVFQLQQGDTEAARERLNSLTMDGDLDVVANPEVVSLSFGVYRALQEADSEAHQAGLTFLEAYAEQLPVELVELQDSYGDSLAAFSVRESTKVRLGGAFQAWMDGEVYGVIQFLEGTVGAGNLTVDQEVLARALLAGAYLDAGRSEEAESELVRILGFDPAYDAEVANARATELYGVTPFNEALLALFEQMRNRVGETS